MKRRRVSPSVRPSPFFNTSVRHACLSPFNKCYVGNTIHRRLHCVIFSSSSPQRCKGYQTHNSPYSRWWRDTPFSFTLRSQASYPYLQQRPATSLYVRLPSTTGTSPRRRSSPADHRIVVQSRRRRDVQSATRLQFVSNRTTAMPVLRLIVPIANMADRKTPASSIHMLPE